MQQAQHKFEQLRNNTSIFSRMQQWRERVLEDYGAKQGLHRILSDFQYQTCRYMAGDYLDASLPRGLLLFHKQGSGKTRVFLATSLYVLSTREDIYKKAIVVIIINKALQTNVVNELQKYVKNLNRAGLGLDFKPSKKPLDFAAVRDVVRFITYNDTRNFQKNIAAQFETLTGYQQKFVIVDEAHNLFRSAVNSFGLGNQEENVEARGHQLYQMFMKYKDL